MADLVAGPCYCKNLRTIWFTVVVSCINMQLYLVAIHMKPLKKWNSTVTFQCISLEYTNQLVLEQHSNESYQRICENLSDINAFESASELQQSGTKSYRMLNNMLYKVRSHKEIQQLLFMFRTIRADTLAACHNNFPSGNIGFAGTREKVNSRFYFSFLLLYVKIM